MSRGLLRRAIAAGAAGVLVSGLFVGVTAVTPAHAHPEDCATHDKDEGHQGEGDICFSDEEIAAMDDSGAELGVGDVASSDNLRLLANVPKSGPFAAESAFSSDLAFQGRYAYQGNYEGFTVWDVSKRSKPRIVSQVHCPGSQNDVSVHEDLLITSTDSSRNTSSCEGNTSQSATVKESWEGIRIFDISDPDDPELVTAVETDCGSHTNTVIPDEDNDRLVVYVSSYNPNTTHPDCQPPHDKISVVSVPTDEPESAEVVSEPVLFPDGGFPGGEGRRDTQGCHDITAYPEKQIAAGACMGEGVLIDISDLEQPTVIDSVTDENFAFWHSATFSNDADSVVFTDELGGGGGPTCNPTVGPNRGADAVYSILDTPAGKKMVLRSYFKIPRTQHNTENCVAHNGSLIPVKGRDIMVQAWYQGGISVWEFTDPANPKEIAWFDRGPLSTERLILGGSWSAYWYRGAIYSSDIQAGFDVLELKDKAVKGARGHKADRLNVQSQESYRG